MSILAKYSLWLLGILAVAVACITGASLVYQQKSLTKEAILRGKSLALNLEAPAADALLEHDNLTLISLASNATRDNQGLAYAAIVNAKGNVVGHPDQQALLKPLDFESDGAQPTADGLATVLTGQSAGRRVWDISVPVQVNGSERILGSVHVGLDRSVVATAVKSSLVGLAAIGLAILVLGVGLAFVALEVLVEPLRELSKASEAVGRGDFGVSVAVRGSDEVGRLSSNFNAMVAGLKVAESAKLEQGRIEGELSMARAIQFDLLLDQPPSVKGLDIAFTCLPAKELGGDFYDCIPLENGSWGFLIADVSGKGVPAALHMTNMRNLFRIFAPGLSSPLETLKKINAMAFMDMKTEAFVTLIYIVLNPKTRKASMVNAGHDPAYWLRADGITALPSTAPPVGLAPPGEYDAFAHEVDLTLSKGDSLFTFTDGVTEAMNPSGEQFSLDRLKLSLAKGGNSDEAMQRLLAAVNGHAAGREQRDDITMLTVKVA